MRDRQYDDPNARDVGLLDGAVTRRDLLAQIGAGCLGLLAIGTLEGCSRPSGPGADAGQLLSANQMQLLSAFVNVIIPDTETPGAAAAGVHRFIDDQLANCQSPAEGGRFVLDLDRSGDRIRQKWGDDYWALPEQTRIEAMTALAEHRAPFDKLSPDFFDKLKRLTVLGYYLSEIGSTQELVYLPVPGGYDGYFKVSDNNGKAFAPHRY